MAAQASTAGQLPAACGRLLTDATLLSGGFLANDNYCQQLAPAFAALLHRRRAHEFLGNTFGKEYDPANVQWCLTVPAAWDDKGKQRMRAAAHQAGMITTLDSPDLTITYEPEAAALYALRHGTNRLRHGDTFMIVDAGGGTVDITLHSVDDSDLLRGPVLAEEVPGGATLTGGTFVDSQWQAAFIREKLGGDSSDSDASELCAEELREGMLEQHKR